MSSFSPEQQRAIDKKDGNMVVISAAGSGKTTVIVNRVAAIVKSGVDPQRILCVTFSKKAKENMAERLEPLIGKREANKTNIETFHSLALKIIKQESSHPVSIFTNEYEKKKVIHNLLLTNKLLPTEKVYKFNVVNFLSWIGTIKNKMLSIQQNIEIMTDPVICEKFTEDPLEGKIYFTLWELYEGYKRNNHLIEFDDMVNMAIDFLQEENVRDFYSHKFEYILSDEYQDTSLNRATLIKLLSKHSKSVFVVGDALQCIFGFTGADNTSIMEFDKEYDAEVVHMDTNYRSNGNIIALANKFAECMTDSHHRNYKPVKAFKEAGTKPVFRKFLSDRSEAEAIAKEIKKDVDDGKIKPEDVAILSRTNAQLARIQMELFKAGLKFTLVDGTGFTQLREIKMVLSYMRLVNRHSDDYAFRQIYNSPYRWLDKVFLTDLEDVAKATGRSLYDSMTSHPKFSKFRNGIQKLRTFIEDLSSGNFQNVGQYVNKIRNMPASEEETFEQWLGSSLDKEGRDDLKDNLDMLVAMCNDFGTVSECLYYFSNMNKQFYNDSKEEDTKDKVSLMSMHKSKGLEFPRVYLIGCCDGLLPHSRTIDPESDKRLFYVAVTRAKEDLRMSASLMCKNKMTEVSPYIDEVEGFFDREDGKMTKKSSSQLITEKKEEKI